MCLEDGSVPIDNSACERAIRQFCVGRNNWHIFDSIHSAVASATVYSLAKPVKANRLKPYKYLKRLPTEISMDPFISTLLGILVYLEIGIDS